jgi:predicted peptidase
MLPLKRTGLAALLLITLPLAAIAVADDPVKTGFVDKVYKDADGKEYKYVVFIPPAYKGDKDYPCILFLHGSGSKGSDGKKQAGGGLAAAIRKKQNSFAFIAVFPQAEKGWGAKGDDAKHALAILDTVAKDYKVDKKHVYLTGLSMGGFGTWALAAAYPERWAAIAPICGGGDLKTAAKIKDLPCWCFHGDADKTVSVEQSRKMIKALKDAGGEPKYTEYEGVDHNSWDRAYATAELYEWFLKHSTK